MKKAPLKVSCVFDPSGPAPEELITECFLIYLRQALGGPAPETSPGSNVCAAEN